MKNNTLTRKLIVASKNRFFIGFMLIFTLTISSTLSSCSGLYGNPGSKNVSKPASGNYTGSSVSQSTSGAHPSAASPTSIEIPTISDNETITSDQEQNQSSPASGSVNSQSSPSTISENNQPSPSPEPTKDISALAAPITLPSIMGLDLSWVPKNGLKPPVGWTGPIAYLTFDDGPSFGRTPKVLAILKAYGIKATFFVVGGHLTKDKEPILSRFVAEGHAVANHTTSHFGAYKSLDVFKSDVDRTSQRIRQMTGTEPIAFRYPGGSATRRIGSMFPATVQFLNERNLEYYDWSTSCGDGNGSVYYTAQQLCNNTMKHVGGQKTMVVLMHDSQPPAGKTGHDLIGGLPLIIKALYQKGYRFSEMHKDMPRVHQR